MKPELLHQGKVRDVYAYGNDLLLVASDRISAFDVILPTPIPHKGIALTQMSRFWFEHFSSTVPHHIISFDLPPELDKPEWKFRTTWCKRAKPLPLECVVRGYITGSGWVDYQKTGCVQGYKLPETLRECDRLPEPLFTPSTKAAEGHDEPLTEAQAIEHVGKDLYNELKLKSLAIYQTAHEFALQKGIIIADTKFEFGIVDGKVYLIDELLTPDSSRFWPKDTYAPGKSQPSFDKQFVRDYLLSLKGWNRQPPGPVLPKDIVTGTQLRYEEAYRLLTGSTLPLP